MNNPCWFLFAVLSLGSTLTVAMIYIFDSSHGPFTRLVVIAGTRSFIFYDRKCTTFLAEFEEAVMRKSGKIVLADDAGLTVLTDETLHRSLSAEELKLLDWHQKVPWGTTCVIRNHPLMRKIEEIEEWDKSGLAWANKTTYESSKNNNYPIMPF